MQKSNSLRSVRTGEYLKGNLEVIAYMARDAFALRFRRDGEKEQFLAFMLIPRYLYSLTFSTLLLLILNLNCLQLVPLLNIRHFVFFMLTSSFHLAQYAERPPSFSVDLQAM